MTSGHTTAPAGAGAEATPSVLREHSFLALLASKTTSTIASAVTWVVLPLYVYEATGSASLAGAMSAVNVVPFILFGLIVGALVDRSSPRSVMLTVELVNAAVLLTVPALLMLTTLPLPAVFVIAFVSSAVYVWFDVASAALIPAVAGPSRVFQANGHMWSTQTLVQAAAAPAGFYLLNERGMSLTFALLAGCYVLSAAAITRVREGPAAPPTRGPVRFPGREIVEGFRFIVHQRTVRMLTVVSLGCGLSGGAVYGMIVVFGDLALGLDADDYRISWIIATSSGGALLASFVAPRLRRYATDRVVIALLVLDAVLLSIYAQSRVWTAALVTIGAWNVVHTSLMIVSISARQVLAPARLQGRVNAAARLIAWGSVPVGTALCGALTDVTGSSRLSIALFAVPVTASLLAAVALPWDAPSTARPNP